MIFSLGVYNDVSNYTYIMVKMSSKYAKFGNHSDLPVLPLEVNGRPSSMCLSMPTPCKRVN